MKEPEDITPTGKKIGNKIEVKCNHCKSKFRKEDGIHHVNICDLNPKNAIEGVEIYTVGRTIHFECKHHKQTFSNKSNCLKHMKNVHKQTMEKNAVAVPKFTVVDDKLKCDNCNRVYSNLSNFNKHATWGRCDNSKFIFVLCWPSNKFILCQLN